MRFLISAYFGYQFFCFILVIVEIFYVFIPTTDMAGYLMIDIVLCMEALAIVAGFTTVPSSLLIHSLTTSRSLTLSISIDR